jgi:hypothetical protein
VRSGSLLRVSVCPCAIYLARLRIVIIQVLMVATHVLSIYDFYAFDEIV